MTLERQSGSNLILLNKIHPLHYIFTLFLHYRDISRQGAEAGGVDPDLTGSYLREKRTIMFMFILAPGLPSIGL